GLLNTAMLHLHLIHQPMQLLPSKFAILLGLVYGELPFMILPLYASLEKLDRTLLEAGKDLGASGRSTFWRVTVPLTMPGILAVYLFLYGPIAILVLFSFNRSKYISSWEGFSLRWYVALWNDDAMQACIRNSLIVGALATVIATAIGTLGAVAMAGGRFRGK